MNTQHNNENDATCDVAELMQHELDVIAKCEALYYMGGHLEYNRNTKIRAQRTLDLYQEKCSGSKKFDASIYSYSLFEGMTPDFWKRGKKTHYGWDSFLSYLKDEYSELPSVIRITFSGRVECPGT